MINVRDGLASRAPFADVAFRSTPGGGVVAQDLDGLGIASVLIKRGLQDTLARRVHERFGMELPVASKRSSIGDTAFIATGPGAWLATRESGGNSFARLLSDVLSECASISDQSDGQAVLRVSGPKVRQVLCKLVPIDLHPLVFCSGDVAVTVAAHIGMTLWRLDDDRDGHAVFDIAIYRSLVGSFWAALSCSAAEFGFEIRG